MLLNYTAHAVNHGNTQQGTNHQKNRQ